MGAKKSRMLGFFFGFILTRRDSESNGGVGVDAWHAPTMMESVQGTLSRAISSARSRARAPQDAALPPASG
jgi:hypothetical protein